MLFRYDFDKKIDLSLFRKQAIHYIPQMEEINFYLVFEKYRIEVAISRSTKSTAHLASISFNEIFRDEDGEINDYDYITPSSDLRFKEITDITSIFPIDERIAHLDSTNVEKTVNVICSLAKILSKIDNLKAFL